MTIPAPRHPDTEAGFTLVEILVSIVLLTVMLASLAPTTMGIARLSTGSTITMQRAAVLAGEAQRVEMIRFDALAAGTTCYDLSSTDFRHSKCVTVADLNATTKRVTMVVTPTGGVPDTLIVDRTKGARYNPLSQ